MWAAEKPLEMACEAQNYESFALCGIENGRKWGLWQSQNDRTSGERIHCRQQTVATTGEGENALGDFEEPSWGACVDLLTEVHGKTDQLRICVKECTPADYRQDEPRRPDRSAPCKNKMIGSRNLEETSDRMVMTECRKENDHL